MNVKPDCLRIVSVESSGQRIAVSFEVSGTVERHFRKERLFWAEYSRPLHAVPAGISVIPFLCDVLPVVWLSHGELVVPELDKDFYNAIPRIREGFQAMYPDVALEGCVRVGKTVSLPHDTCARCGLLFSGGVDSMASLLAHRDEHPGLLSVWGADIAADNEAAWRNVRSHVRETAASFGLEEVEIRSNFRDILSPRFDSLFRHYEFGYWGNIQHGIALLGLTAPYAYGRYDRVYISSTFPTEYRMLHPWGSDPRCDEAVRFGGTHVVHDLKDCSRQDKVGDIVNYCHAHGRPVHLRVCWESTRGRNCCRCEKCLRTAMNLIAAGENPADYGLPVTHSQLRMLRHCRICTHLQRWREIRDELSEGRFRSEYADICRWVSDYDLDGAYRKWERTRWIRQIYHKVRRILSPLRHGLMNDR